MSNRIIHKNNRRRLVETPEGTAIIENKYKESPLEVNVYTLKKGKSFHLNPPKTQGAVKSYWVISGELHFIEDQENYKEGTMIVLRPDDEVFSILAIEETQLLVHSVLDNSFDKAEENFRYIYGILKQIQEKDAYTFDHSESVYSLVKKMATALGYKGQRYLDLMWASKYHDIGKIYIPDAILNKPESLTDEEYEVMKTHVIKGKDLILQFFNERVYRIASQHHERYDGSGYPLGLVGDDISEEARLIAICDSFDAMTSGRIYKKAKSHHEALKEIQALSGILYDPELVGLFISFMQ